MEGKGSRNSHCPHHRPRIHVTGCSDACPVPSFSKPERLAQPVMYEEVSEGHGTVIAQGLEVEGS